MPTFDPATTGPATSETEDEEWAGPMLTAVTGCAEDRVTVLGGVAVSAVDVEGAWLLVVGAELAVVTLAVVVLGFFFSAILLWTISLMMACWSWSLVFK